MEKLLIFDYDGTIHETMRIYEPAFRSTFAWLVENGWAKEREIPARQVAGWLGMNSREMWQSFLPELPEPVQRKAAAMTGHVMAEGIRAGKAAWYPGAEEALDRLKAEGYTLVVLSNCRVEYRRTSWEVFGMGKWFSEFYDCETYGFAPKTEIIREVEKKYGPPSAVIGDRRSDLDCAKAAGCLFIGCAYGFGTSKELEGASALAESVRELPELASRLLLNNKI